MSMKELFLLILKSFSSFCNGNVFHQRFVPKPHGFKYKMFMPLLDLDDIEKLHSFSKLLKVNKFWLYSFYPADYLKEVKPKSLTLKQKVIEVLKSKENFDVTSEQSVNVCLLAHWRCLGMLFNPLSQYYVYIDGKLSYLVSEVSNTPWNERHIYTRKLTENGALEKWSSDKSFHVSPFNNLDMAYQWRSQVSRSNLTFGLTLLRGTKTVFTASYNYSCLPFTSKQFNRGIRRQPFLSLHGLIGIYWQALKLIFKRIPFYSHPKYNK